MNNIPIYTGIQIFGHSYLRNFMAEVLYMPKIVWTVTDFIIPILVTTVYITCIGVLLIGLCVGFYNYVVCAYNPRQRYRIRSRGRRSNRRNRISRPTWSDRYPVDLNDDSLITALRNNLRRISTWWDRRRPVYASWTPQARRRGRRPNSANNYLEQRPNRLSQKEFKCLPKRVMTKNLIKELNLATEPECIICMEKISNRQHMSMPCSQEHYFHIKCSRKWLTQKCKQPTCPICRENIRNRIINNN